MAKSLALSAICAWGCATPDAGETGVCVSPGGAPTGAVDLPPLKIEGESPSAGFDRLGPPMRGAWRTRVRERPQSFVDYQLAGANEITAERKTLYLQPLGDYPHDAVLEGDLPSTALVEDGLVSRVFAPRPEELRAFVEGFYGMQTRLAQARPLEAYVAAPLRVRKHHAQFDAQAIVSAMRSSVPSDAYSLTALVARDMFVIEEQDYAFGYGLHRERVAVASFVQLDPQFLGRPRATDFQQRIRERAYKLVAHEVGHTLGFEHCGTYGCVMNGVAHLDELDATPLRLCPICLRKLAWLRGVELSAEQVRRYGQLEAFYAEHQLPAARAFVAQRVAAQVATVPTAKR